MAELQRKKQMNKKMEVTGTGNGIGGLLALGGALAAAAFLAAISKQSNKSPNNSPVGKPQPKPKPTKNPPSGVVNCSKKDVQGLLPILETTSLSEENHRCIEEDGSRTCSTEQKSVSNTKRKDEGITCENGNSALDSLKTDSSAAADYDVNDTTPSQVELNSFSDGIHGLIDNQTIKVVGNKKEDCLNSSLAETVATFKESAEVIKELKTTDREVRVLEEYPSMQIDDDEEEEEEEAEEEEEEEDGNDDDGEKEEEETVEEGSDGTGDSSMESNTEAIWPVDSTEEFTVKVIKSHVESSGKDEKSVEMEIKSGMKISKEYDGKGTAHDKDAERRNDKQQNDNFEITRKMMKAMKEEKNKACETMQMKKMNSALNARPIWVWVLVGFMFLMLGHIIYASFYSNVV